MIYRAQVYDSFWAKTKKIPAILAKGFGHKSMKFQSEFHVWASKILAFDNIYSSYCLNFESSIEIDMLDSRY